MASIPLALGFGIAGIVCDRRKLLAIIATAVAGLFVLFYLCMMGISIMHMW
ncbi:MAG: hypothetical protein JSU70_19535 [Phycisphaerales bacterium]|nr:MAG: hypothetical protein JSU70_19535 [Phycisphaerales bacterium]